MPPGSTGRSLPRIDSSRGPIELVSPGPSTRRSRRVSRRRCGGQPALTEMNAPSGGEAWPSAARPQQATEPSAMTPQECQAPALTETNVPAGGEACPNLSSPQQAIEPSVLTPQVTAPALTEVNEPEGGEACPLRS